MKKWTLLVVCLVLALTTGLPARTAETNDKDDRLVVTVAFGVGLNTAFPPPNGGPNHHVLPGVIKVKKGGVVSFNVSGFHHIYVYAEGTKREDIIVPGTGFLVNGPTADPTMFYYRGIAPAGGPLATPATVNPSNAINRVEGVSFKEAGTYLVICNIRGHLLDGMYAYVKVSDDDEDDDKN